MATTGRAGDDAEQAGDYLRDGLCFGLLDAPVALVLPVASDAAVVDGPPVLGQIVGHRLRDPTAGRLLANQAARSRRDMHDHQRLRPHSGHQVAAIRNIAHRSSVVQASRVAFKETRTLKDLLGLCARPPIPPGWVHRRGNV